MHRFAFLVCALLPVVAAAQANTANTASADRSGTEAVEFWAGYSARSPKWGFLGNRPGLSFAIMAARGARRVKTTEKYALDYTVDFIPLAMQSPPVGWEPPVTSSYLDPDADRTCHGTTFECRFPMGSAYGMGVSPLGFTFTYRRDSFVQPRIGGTGGILMFDRKVPTIISSRFNFTATVEAGVQLLNRNGDGVLALYRFHHLSNAGMAEDNSALASHVISIGARLRTGRH